MNESYFKRKKNQLKEYQKTHKWAKPKYLIALYAAWWGIKIGAFTYGPVLINNIRNSIYETIPETIESPLENLVDSTYIYNPAAKFDMAKSDAKIEPPYKSPIKPELLEILVK